MHGGDQHKQLLHVPRTHLASFPGLVRLSLAVCYKLNIRSWIVINPWVHQTSLYFAMFRSRETFFGQSYNSGTHNCMISRPKRCKV